MHLPFPLLVLVDCGANMPATFAASPQQADKVDLPHNLLGPHCCTVKAWSSHSRAVYPPQVVSIFHLMPHCRHVISAGWYTVGA